MNLQAQKVSFVYRSQFTSDAAEALAKKIADQAIGNLNWSFLLTVVLRQPKQR